MTAIARRVSLAIVPLSLALGCLCGCAQQPAPPSAAAEARHFAVEGMSCEGCVNSITAKLKQVPGVQSVQVSLAEKKATIVADPQQVPSAKIEAAIKEIGYEAKLIGSRE